MKHSHTQTILKPVFTHLHDYNDIVNFAIMSKTANRVVNTIKYLQLTNKPSPVKFPSASHFIGKFSDISRYTTDFRMTDSFTLIFEDDEDLKAFNKPINRVLLYHCTNLRLCYLENLSLSFFYDLHLRQLIIDYSNISFSDSLRQTLDDLSKLFSKSLKRITLDNVMITDKHLPSILDVINESAPTAKVLLNVVKKDDHLLYPETIKQINPNVQLFFKFNLFTPFSIQYCDISLKECYIHPSVINSPIIIYPQKNLNVSKIEEVCQRYAIQGLSLMETHNTSKIPNVQLQKLIVKGFLPNAVYSNDKLKCLNELEISEKTEKMSSTEEYYFGKFSQLTCLKVGDDALESSTKTRKCTLPYSLKQLYLRQGFVNIRDGVEVNNVNGIQHLNKLTFLTLEPYLDSFDNVQFPKSLIDIRFNRAPQFKDMSQFHQLTNLTHVVLNDCESLITPILPESVIELKLSYCTNVKSLDISHLSNLTLLELGQYNDTDIKLPTYLSELSIAQSQKFISLDLSYVKIKDITIDRCEKLVEVTLPTSLEVATIKDCDELNRIDLSKMKQLEDLVLEMLPLLKSLLLSSNIKVLSVGDLEILDSIENMSFFKNLVEVSVIGCPCIKTLTLPSQLQQLDLNDNSDLVTLNKGDLRNCKCTILDCPNLGDDY